MSNEPHPASAGPTASLVDHALALADRGLDGPLQHHATRQLIDTLGAVLAGSDQPVTRRAATVLSATQGPGATAVPGLALRLGLLDAAYVSGVAAHATEMDDGYRPGSIHPGAVVVPALLGLATAHRISGARLLEALAVGYQTLGSISACAHPRLRRRGFHPTSAIGPFGAAGAAGALLGLARTQRLAALGLAASSAAGLFAFKAGGADVKRLHAGHAAREGVLAALLAQDGCEGPPGVLEGPDGFFQAFAGLDPGSAVIALPPMVPDTIADCYIKPYACCRHIQPAVDALQALQRTHHIGAEAIEAIEVETYGIAADHAQVPWASLAEAQLSFPYVLAVAARHADLGVARFDDTARADPDTSALARRVVVRRSDAMDARYPAQRPACVTVQTALGRWQLDVSEAVGAPEYPLDDAGVGHKFLELALPALGPARAADALARLWQIATLRDVTPLLASLSPA